MSDPLRTDGSRALPAAPEADRDAKIEQLLLVGLDQYFAAQYDQAIHVWTRVLFLDRTHARARAYIERARSARAERQRESGERLRSGVAAFERGQNEEPTPVLDRLARLEVPTTPLPRTRARRLPGGVIALDSQSRAGLSPLTVLLILAASVTAAAAYTAVGPLDWRSLLSLQASTGRSTSPIAARESRLALARARTLAAEGRARDALNALDLVRSTDPEREDAVRLRTDIQRQLIAVASGLPVAAPSPPVDGRVP